MTQPGREKWAQENVRRQRHDCYLPLFLQVRGSEERVRPLFPGYLFVHTFGRWQHFRSTFGIRDLIMGDDGPATIPPGAIRELRGREGDDGLVHLDAPPADDSFLPGETLRVTAGPLWGYKGIWTGASDHERRTILMEFMGRVAPVTVRFNQLERAS